MSTTPKFTSGALRAAEVCHAHIKSSSYAYSPEEAAADIDRALQLPQIIEIIQEMVDEAKRDLASSDSWTTNTVRVSKGHIKTLSNLVRELSNE